MTDLPPPDDVGCVQFDVEDSRVVRQAAEDLRAVNRRAARLQVALVAFVGLCVAVAGLALWRVAVTNKRGVERIVSCTTPGLPCYEEQQMRTNELVGTLLVQLSEGHLVLECYLGVPPEERTVRTLTGCKAQAAEQVKANLDELHRKTKEQADKAKRKANGGGG